MSQSMSKRKKVQGSLYSFFGGKLLSDDKDINTESETPAPTRRHGRINTNGWGLTRKQNVLFCGEFPKRKTWNTPLGSEQKNFKMIKVISSFADGPLNFNPTSPAEEDRTQKLISALKRLKQGCNLNAFCL